MIFKFITRVAPLWLVAAALVACASDETASSVTPAQAAGAGGSGGATEAGAGGDSGEAGASSIGGGAGAAGDPSASRPILCGASFPGVPLAEGLVEDTDDYAERLAATDVSAVPDPFDFDGESTIVKAVIRYMLGDVEAVSVSHEDAAKKGGMHLAVLAAAAKTKDKGASGKVDVAFLRQGLHHFYPCTEQPPRTLAALRAEVGDYTTWASEDIACGAPKDGPRRLFVDAEQGVYIAETLVDGEVRETEIVFDKRRADGQLSFAVYTPKGELTDRSTFATNGGGEIVAAAPFTCMSCHLDSDTFRYEAKRPEGTGAGCR